MNMIFVLLNALACVVIFWVAGTFLLVGEKANNLRRITLQLALLVAMVGGFIAAVATFAGYASPPWWAVLLHTGVAGVAAFAYDQSFGIARQAQCLRGRVLSLPVKIHQWWLERVAIAEQHARSRRP